jgi:hypothetical protein
MINPPSRGIGSPVALRMEMSKGSGWKLHF